MAEASFSQDQFSCSVCLDLLKDPVTIPCGHSYCMSCITDCWKQKRVYRHTFTSRPALCKNVIIAEMVEKLKTTDLQTAEPGNVECDVCTGKKYKAVKSCVECLNSYCQSHLEQHENLFKDRRHNLMDPIKRLHEMISWSITYADTPQHFPAHPDRFDGCVQVLCRESVWRRCYWEAEWSGRKSVCISVSYKSISRKQLFGFNNQSWSLFCSSFSYVFRHNNIKTEVPVSSWMTQKLKICIYCISLQILKSYNKINTF